MDLQARQANQVLIDKVYLPVQETERPQPRPMLPEVGIEEGTSHDPMVADTLSGIIEGVQKQFPQHSRKVIEKYYKYIVTYNGLEIMANGFQVHLISEICDLIHKVQTQSLIKMDNLTPVNQLGGGTSNEADSE